MSDLRAEEKTTGATCSAEPGCITCGDVAIVLTVASVEGSDARCRDAAGQEELVATELVGGAAVGERLLVHAGVAIERVQSVPAGEDIEQGGGAPR